MNIILASCRAGHALQTVTRTFAGPAGPGGAACGAPIGGSAATRLHHRYNAAQGRKVMQARQWHQASLRSGCGRGSSSNTTHLRRPTPFRLQRQAVQRAVQPVACQRSGKQGQGLHKRPGAVPGAPVPERSEGLGSALGGQYLNSYGRRTCVPHAWHRGIAASGSNAS